ncbi:hypothetical protein [uncultured Clostridium sp.]|jgi:hypothetical protein|uniref:hypothetical protein n=1 Tax=uncultured Clostridium sp. TaxID=59620 RepID=UPI00272BABBB|nr:hypothetical protein [uncultured Clostridium sp.]MCI8617110.1 hypothetical protein [Clostridia bacterium]
MNNNQMIDILTIVLGIMISILFILCTIFVILKIKTRKPKEKKVKKDVTPKGQSSVSQSYIKQSIYKFMEFDKIDDNMIIQKDGKRFLMVIECQGINYDLMSGIEKNSVEQGFLQFLNTLRYPIQIYVQTRTVNLSGSINNYKERVDNISRQYANKQMEYNQKVRSGQYSDEELAKEKYELARQKNLYEYGIDIVNNTEKMSLNKNILSKHYYIIISYYSEEALNGDFAKDEISNLAFSELYTKAQSIISSLSVCDIKGKVLDSTQLAELLYVAYNRDESEIFNLRRALNAGYEDLYSTAPDVLDKRIKELDIKIEEEAIRKANEAVYSIVEDNQKQARLKQKEKELDDLIDQMAMTLIEEQEALIGKDISKQAVEKIRKDSKNKTKEKGGEENGKKTTERKNTKSI